MLLKLLIDAFDKTVKRMLAEFSRFGKTLMPIMMMVFTCVGFDLNKTLAKNPPQIKLKGLLGLER